MNREIAFRPLTSQEEALGYQVLVNNVAWQGKKGIFLWDKPFPRQVYSERQQQGENFGLFVDGSLAAIVSLVHGVPTYWSTFVENPKAIWLCTLAVADAFHGKGVGKVTVEKALAFLREGEQTVVWLDCTPGFLERFYVSLGFVPVMQQQIFIPHAGKCLDCVLLKKLLA